MGRRVRILVVDDHPLVRRGLSCLLAAEEEMEVVGEAEDGPTGLARAIELKADVVLLDYNMPGMNGADATRALLARRRRTVVIGISTDGRARQAMEEAGASGFLLKGDEGQPLRTLICQAVERKRE